LGKEWKRRDKNRNKSAWEKENEGCTEEAKVLQ
jgi:hypothetical protein